MTTAIPSSVAVKPLVYRPDIDGLRAIAVAAVVIFHGFPTLVPGGFVGVDIFFVISGFLITGILLSELEGQRFSIAKFYARRIRRIFPALVTVLIFTFAVGWFCLLPDELKQLGKDIAAGAGFVANLTLWNETGYFDRAADTKPLLHLWSLGVEEQFYIVWPLLLALAYKFRQKLTTLAVLALILSFCLNVALIVHHPLASFFSPLCRFWELMVGGLLAMRSQKQKIADVRSGTTLSLIGAALLLVAIFGFNSTLLFPGWWALIPAAGAGALLASGRAAFFNRRVLANPVMVWIGKISYPLYLWHWPLLSFATILAGQQPAPQARAALLIVSVLLAWLTYAVIEKPFRFGKRRPITVVLPCLTLLLVGSIGFGVFRYDIEGYGKAYSAYADVSTAAQGMDRRFAKGGCGVASSDEDKFYCVEDTREAPQRVMWGDSKAEALYWGFLSQSKPGERWRLIGKAGCAPLTGVIQISPHLDDSPERCEQALRIALRSIADNPEIKLVTLVTAARVLTDPVYAKTGSNTPDPSGALDGLDNTINTLHRAGKDVAFVIDNPTLPPPRECMNRNVTKFRFIRKLVSLSRTESADDKCTISYDSYMNATVTYRALVARLHAMHPDVLIYDPTPVLCDMQKQTCPISMNGKFLYSYGDHVSDYANSLIAEKMLPQIDRSRAPQ